MKANWNLYHPNDSIKDAPNDSDFLPETKNGRYKIAVKLLSSGTDIPPHVYRVLKVTIRYMERYYPELCI